MEGEKGPNQSVQEMAWLDTVLLNCLGAMFLLVPKRCGWECAGAHCDGRLEGVGFVTDGAPDSDSSTCQSHRASNTQRAITGYNPVLYHSSAPVAVCSTKGTDLSLHKNDIFYSISLFL